MASSASVDVDLSAVDVVLSAAEVAAHNRPDSCWLVIHGVVYDVTAFLMVHPGGPMVFSHVAGADATAPFEVIGHSQRALRLPAHGCFRGHPLVMHHHCSI